MNILILSFLFITTDAFINDYITGFKSYFGISSYNRDKDTDDVFQRKVPYEVSTLDEKFLSESAKLTGVVLSELDSCQHRVVLKLQTDCNKMNDEQLAKMAVHLLNCQSYVEGRKIFPCHDDMPIKDCTINMDADTWTSYHLISNRVRAVCYSIRQTQFRGLAEHTVNRLMDAAQDQLKTLLNIAEHQVKLKNIAESTYDTITKDHETLISQQQDLQKAQFHGQLAIEDNIRRLEDEKLLILQTHNQLIDMTKVVQNKLEDSLTQMDEQTGESRSNHRELIDDLLNIQSKTKEIFKKIDESSTLLIKQNMEVRNQYEATLKNLQEVNKTVHSLVALMGGTREALEKKLSWITNALGGTDIAIERIYLILWHAAFILIAMLVCAFLSASPYTRLIVATLPPANLVMALYEDQEYFKPVALTSAVLVLILVQNCIVYAVSWIHQRNAPMLAIREHSVPPTKRPSSPDKESEKSFVTSTNIRENVNNQSEKFLTSTSSTPSRFQLDHSMEENNDSFDLTPPVSRNGYYPFYSRSRSRSNTPLKLNTTLKSSCSARTRLGTPCKLTAAPGRDFCYRHQTGDSVMG